MVHIVPAQLGAFARAVQAAGWQHASGTQSASVRHEGWEFWSRPGLGARLLPSGPTMGGISDCRPVPGEGWSGWPDCTLEGDGGLAEADAGPGSA